MGWIKNPKKALYNKVYNKTSFSLWDILKGKGVKGSQLLLTPLDKSTDNKGESIMKSNKKAAFGIIGVATAIFLFIAGVASCNNETDYSENTENTTVVERIVMAESSEETTEVITTEAQTTTVKATTTTSTTKKPTTTTERRTTEPHTIDSKQTYILNTNSMKFHKPSCRGVKDMKEENKQEYKGTRQDVIDMGYSPCGICHP